MKVTINKDIYNTQRIKNILNGEYRTGSAPWGYRFSRNSILEPDPEKFPYIKILFEEYATKKHSYRTLALWLFETHGIHIAKNTLAGTLSNSFYYGYQRYNGKLFKHIYPVGITKELFEQVQAIIILSGMRRVKTTAFPFLYRTIIKCGNCKSPLNPHETRNTTYKYYTCKSKRRRKEECSNKVKEEELTVCFKNLFNDLCNGLYPIFLKSNLYNKKLICNYMFESLEYNNKSLNYTLKDINLGAILDDINNILGTESSELLILENNSKFNDPLLDLCKKPQTIETIMNILKISLNEVQSKLMDLQLDGKIVENSEGKWISIH